MFVERVTDDRLISVGAENDPYRRIVAGIHHFAFVVMLVELHLPDVLRYEKTLDHFPILYR